MKFTYKGAVPQVGCTDDGLLTVRTGEVVDLPSAPTVEFIPVSTPKPKAKVKSTPPAKKKPVIQEEVKDTRSK